MCYYTHRDIYNNARISLTRVHMQKLCHLKFGLPILTTIIQEDRMPTSIIHGKWDSHMCMMKKTIEESIS